MVIILFVVSTFAAVSPVNATFTLGDLTGTYRYHQFDFDPHTQIGNGVVGYVWPGGGQNALSGFPNFANVNNAPGYQSPYPGGKPGFAPGFSGSAPSSSWYQLQGDAYAPFGAVLAGSTGDLIFAINSTCTDYTVAGITIPVKEIVGTAAAPGQSSSVSDTPTPFAGALGCVGFPNEGWDTIAIYIPPGFTVPGAQQVVSTISNDYSGYFTYTAAPYDRYGPGWTVVYVEADTITNAPNVQGAVGGSLGNGLSYNHQFINFTHAAEWYYVRVNGVTAPSIAGRYFFKIELINGMELTGSPPGPTYRIGGEEGVSSSAGSGEQSSQFIPTENWPVMLVKGEIDPGIITGTIRYAGYNQTLYNQPVQEAGRVYAKMTTRLDPYTGQQRPDLPLVDAVAYFNATAKGHYEVEGVAPGVYDLYASAAGYPKAVIASHVTVLKGQSLHFDGYLQPGPVIHGNVFTKHQFGDEPWPTATDTATPNQYIKIELYDGPTLDHLVDSKANMVVWSPLPCVAGGQEQYYNRRDAGYCQDPRLGGAIAAPWHEYVPSRGYFSGVSATNFNFYQVSTGQVSPLGIGASVRMTQDPQGVGPPQHWFVQGGTTAPFHYEFGVKGEYGAPRDLDGMVPQVYATWVNGLTPGRYYARAWTFRYVQSALDGSTFQEYYFDITPNEWAGDVTLPIDLRLSSWVNKTVHFHNVINGIVEDPIDTGAGMMSGVLVDARGFVWSYNQTLLGYHGLYSVGLHSGWGAAAFSNPSTVIHENDLDKAKLNQFAIETGRGNIQFWGWNDTWGGENYGIPSGTYQPHVFALGYIETDPIEFISVTLSGNPTSISNHMFRGVGFNVTVYSIDWERPRVSRPWVWGNPTGYLPFQGLSSGTMAGGCGLMGPTANYWPNGLQTQPGIPGPDGCLVGQEIDVGFYMNGKLINLAGDTLWDDQTVAPDTVTTSCLYQNFTTSVVQMCGGGWDTQIRLVNGTYVTYQGNSNDAFFGVDLGRPGFVGGYTDGSLATLTATTLFALAHYTPSPTCRRGCTAAYNAITGYPALYPTAFPAGQYDLRGFTYGYVQDKGFTAYASAGQVADMKINLVIGVNVTLDILFKKEHIITPTNDNMSARVRLFDDSGNLVAEWMSSEGTYTTASGFARAADGTTQYPFGNLPAIPLPKSLNTYNYLPGGTTLLHVLMAGLPAVPGGGQQVGPSAYAAPKGTYFGDPVVGSTNGCEFGIDCFGNPGANWNNVGGFFPNYGIVGASDYQGGWMAEVDFVNWYQNNTLDTVWSAFPSPNVATSPGGTLTSYGAMYYGLGGSATPGPVPGLLMGESYHIISGTTAKSGISLTEDIALSSSPAGVGGSMAFNHLGPYSQEGVWQIANAHNSGEASAIQEVDLNGLVSGNALAFTWSNEFRPLSWGLLTVTGAGLPSTGLNFYTYDGIYQAYLPSTIGQSGSVIYSFSLTAPGYAPQLWKGAVSSGQSGTGNNLYLEQTNIPIPEFSTITIVAFTALAVSLYILRRRRN
jgi:hypothetical protein